MFFFAPCVAIALPYNNRSYPIVRKGYCKWPTLPSATVNRVVRYSSCAVELAQFHRSVTRERWRHIVLRSTQ